MLLYSIYENGSLRKVKKLNFIDKNVYIIDDDKIIYLWIGKKATDKKKKHLESKIAQIKKERKREVKILEMIQGKEYGSFLALMDILKKGIPDDTELNRRTELKIKVNETREYIEAGLPPDLEAEITLRAHEIALEGKSYEELCQILAKNQLKQTLEKNPTKAEIKSKVDEILKSTSTYIEICWLIAQLELIRSKSN
ncbi:MAG: hypothetical protein ACFFAS_04530 [Promethearchaeota archaeon]